MLEALASPGLHENQRVDLLRLGERRLSWLAHRNAVLSGNIANANTPGYTPSDVSDFAGVLAYQKTHAVAKTELGHIDAHSIGDGVHKIQGETNSIDGNSVRLEDELEKVANTNDWQRFATAAYSRYMSMYFTVLGAGGQG